MFNKKHTDGTNITITRSDPQPDDRMRDAMLVDDFILHEPDDEQYITYTMLAGWRIVNAT